MTDATLQVIGVDTGGTFTDTVVVDAAGRVEVGKALSTPPMFEQGVIDSLTAAAAARDETLDQLLAGTDVVAHGTTVGLNGLLTRTGAKVGLLVTAGFESTLPLAKANKLHGLPEEWATNALRWDKPPLLVPRHLITGVPERIDVLGDVIVPLDEDAARAAIAAFADAGVEAIGVSFLWATVDPRHERRLRELIAELLPDTPVTLSSELAPRLGEYERTSSVVVNAYVAPLVGGYLRRLGTALAGRGFAGELLVMTMAGGVLPLDAAIAAPIHTLQSGPAAGLARARRVGRSTGHVNVVTTDVGGTSFDVGLVVDGELPLARRPMIERQALAVPIVDVASIGTGGGSIAWYDEAIGTLRVGPHSAGSRPGPACYGRGGDRPTLTDAAAVLGYIDCLGSTLTLDVDAAATAIDVHVATPMGWDVHAAAAGIVDIATAQMADLVRRATVRRGHDPGDFVLFGFGGAAPQYVGRYAADLGVRAVVIPFLAAEFSAAGAAMGELRSRAERELAPQPLLGAAEWIGDALAELEARAAAQVELDDAGGEIRLRRRVSVRFFRQHHALEIDLPETIDDAVTETDLKAVAEEFRSRYEHLVGRGGASAEAPIELVGVAVEAVRELRVPALPDHTGTSTPPTPLRHRQAWFDGVRVSCPVYDWAAVESGREIEGPAFVESPQTTAVINPGQRARCDPQRNLVIDVGPVAPMAPNAGGRP